MAKVTFGSGPSFNFSYLDDGDVVLDPDEGDAFEVVMADPFTTDFDSGRILFEGENFVYKDDAIVGGRVTHIEFVGQVGDRTFETIDIAKLDISAKELFGEIDALFGIFPDLVDLVFGGDDVFKGSSASDFIYTGPGDDRVAAAGGNDVIFADAGKDTIDGGDEDARPFGSVDERPGSLPTARGDLVRYDFAIKPVDVDLKRGTAITADGNDTLIDIEGVTGGFGDDKIRGDDGDNWLSGDLGSDLIDGRGGTDVVSFDFSMSSIEGEVNSVKVDLAKGRAVEVSGAVDKLRNVEGVIGTSGHDTILGDGGDNILSGGGFGDDLLTGRGGEDSFLFTAANNMFRNIVISDFTRGEDHLVFDKSLFGIKGKVKVVAEDDPTPTGKAAFFELDSGKLYVDMGGEDRELIATLKGLKDLSIDDFQLF